MFRKKQNNFDLEQIRVASPCPEPWESMTGGDRSRHCGECGLSVFNISGMTRTEAAELIENREGRMCIRLHKRSDGKVLTRDCPSGIKAYRSRLVKYAGSVLSAVLALFSAGYTQRQPGDDSQGIRSESSLSIARIEGTVRDPYGGYVKGATVTVTTRSGRTISRKTDDKGRFDLMSFAMETGPNRLEVDSPGFNSFRDEFRISKRESLAFPISLEIGVVVGIVNVGTAPQIDPKSSSITTTIRSQD